MTTVCMKIPPMQKEDSKGEEEDAFIGNGKIIQKRNHTGFGSKTGVSKLDQKVT